MKELEIPYVHCKACGGRLVANLTDSEYLGEPDITIILNCRDQDKSHCAKGVVYSLTGILTVELLGEGIACDC